jgi:dCTP deaminase
MQIAKLCTTDKPMVYPFVGHQVKTVDNKPVISYGLSSYGYDIRITNVFRIFTPASGFMTAVDPKDMDSRAMVEFVGDVCVIPPRSFALAVTLERFIIPRDVMTICVGKSTYARCGVIINVTPFEPEWEGFVTLEFSNTTPLPAKIYANEGCAQVLFFESDEPCGVSYKDRQGKYQGQVGVTLPVA